MTTTKASPRAPAQALDVPPNTPTQPLSLLQTRLLELRNRLHPNNSSSTGDDVEGVWESASPASSSHLSLDVLDTCVLDATTFFRGSSVMYAPLINALQSVYPAGLLCDAVISSYVDFKSASKADSDAILGYLKELYETVSSSLQARVISQPCDPETLLRAFLTLSKLEFARESCASPDTNAFMNQLTQQVEGAIERSPHHVLSTLLRSAAVAKHKNNHESTSSTVHHPTRSSITLALSSTVAAPDSVVPLEADVIYGAQALVVGVILQRKLRVLLFQSAALVDDALALVFSGLYSGYEPLNAFAHSYLGFCLTHLGQYISIYSLAPYYLQVTLAKYPMAAAQDSLAKTCGVIFGALFFASSAQTQPVISSSSSALTQQQRMVLWAMKQCCDRVAELVLAPQPSISPRPESVTGNNEASQEPEPVDHGAMKSGVYLAGILFEVMKMGPIGLLVELAIEVELLLSKCADSSNVAALHALKTQLFASISQNCDAEKRAWLAAWYVELNKFYPTEDSNRAPRQSAGEGAIVRSRL